MNKLELNSRIYLKESPLSNPYEVFHKFAENFIFFRWMFFKNRPRSTFLMIRAILVNTLIFGAYYALFSNIKFLLMGIEVDPILLYTAGCILGYWNMSFSFSSKCNYLSTMYNDIIKEQSKGNIKSAEILSCNFVTQLLTTDLWAHRLYSWVFIETLTTAIKWDIENKEDHQFKSWAEFVEVANSGKLEIAVARNMVVNYQRHLSSPKMAKVLDYKSA